MLLGRSEARSPLWNGNAEPTVLRTEWQLKWQQPAVPVEARRASGRSARQQPAFNCSSSYVYHATRCGILLALRARYATTEAHQPFSLRGSSHLACAQCHKTNTPNQSDRWLYKRYVLSLCMFPHVNDFKPVYASNACILQKMCNSAPLGYTFRQVAEFSVFHTWNFAADFGMLNLGKLKIFK